MARKSTERATDPRKNAIEALMRLAAERDWDEIELYDIAAEAGLDLPALRGLFPSKGAMLGGFARMIDDAVLAGDGTDLSAEPAKDRLFDVMMRRLDALTPYKAALKRIKPATMRDPLALAALNGVAVNSWRYMLAAAHIPTGDSIGALRLQGAVLLFSRVVDVWLQDEDPALSKTMAALDRGLDRGGMLLARAEDLHRLTAPLRGLARAMCSRRPVRRRPRADDQPAETYSV